MHDEALVLRECLAESVGHVEIRTVVTINDTDDVLDGVLLRLERLQALWKR